MSTHRSRRDGRPWVGGRNCLPSATIQNMKRRFIPLVGLLTVLLLAASAAAEFNEPVVIREGDVGARHWFVDAFQEENTICLEVAVAETRTAEAESGGGQCSYPAVHRGILLVAANRVRGKKPPAMMAVAGGFNPAVSRVRVTMFNGSVKRPRLIDVSNKTPSLVGHFRYMAFAVRGPWCARKVTTLNRNGRPLWEVGWREFNSSLIHDPAHSPGALCRRR